MKKFEKWLCCVVQTKREDLKMNENDLENEEERPCKLDKNDLGNGR